MNTKIVVPFLKTLFLFSLFIWIYVIAMQIAHPESVSWTFTYWFRARMDFVGEAAFITSLVSFFFWQYLNFKS